MCALALLEGLYRQLYKGDLHVQLAASVGQVLVGALTLLGLQERDSHLLCAQLAASAGQVLVGALASLGLQKLTVQLLCVRSWRRARARRSWAPCPRWT